MNPATGPLPQPMNGNMKSKGSVATPQRDCKVALLSGSGACLTQEIETLLLKRLRLATTITALAFVGFVILSFFRPLEEIGPSYLARSLQIGTGLVLAILAATLWSTNRFGLGALRGLELAFFGIMALYFAWAHYALFHEALPARDAVAGKEAAVVRMANSVATLRWFVLIVIYGTFIPNTWRRCLLVVTSFAALPVAITAWLCVFDSVSGPYLRLYIGDLAILLGLALAVAVFGSYKIHELHERAFEAAKMGQYRLKKLLGEGGMGEVYLAEHLLLRRPCAIKMIRPERAGDPKLLRRFEREVQAMATLTHWNTVEVYDYGHAECGSFYYVMEYLPGWSLEDLVAKHGPLPPGRVVHLLRQVCGALHEAHGIGLVHRDIKSSNIITCERGKVYDVAKLLDFGLVKGFEMDGQETKLTQQGLLTGTPAYMSPEQAMGLTDIDGRSDIYSVGAVAYYLLTGAVPFERSTIMQILTAHARDPARPLTDLKADVPGDLEQVVLRCLEKEPGKRYQDVESLEAALAACSCTADWGSEHARSWWLQNDLPSDTAEASETPAQSAATVLASPIVAHSAGN